MTKVMGLDDRCRMRWAGSADTLATSAYGWAIIMKTSTLDTWSEGFNWQSLQMQTFFLGVVWPGVPLALVVGMLGYCEYSSRISGSGGVFTTVFSSPYFTMFFASILMVPIANLFAVHSTMTEDGKPTAFEGFANGYSLVAASAWGLPFSLAIPHCLSAREWALPVFLVVFAPFAGLTAALLLTAAINARAEKRDYWKIQGWSALGLVLGALVLFGPEISFLCHNSLVRTATYAESDAERRTAIRVLRTFGNQSELIRGCYGMFTNVLPVVNNANPASPADYRDVYHQVTGGNFNEVNPPPDYTRWDSIFGNTDQDLAGELVGSKSIDVHAETSIIQGAVDETAHVARMEWSMQFSNDATIGREARAQIKLPHGAVVSKAVLWVDGEAREAAFTDRAKARAAYRNVVVQKRDPLLVSYQGTDRILVQCFPVPPKSSGRDMKILIGITAPIIRNSKEGEIPIALPEIAEANFDRFSPQVHFRLGKAIHIDSTLPKAEMKNLLLVIDGGKSLEKHRLEISEAIRSLSLHANVKVFFASDEIDDLTNTNGGTPGLVAANEILRAPFVGGPDNGTEIEKAFQLARNTPDAAVVWLHGAQPMTRLHLSPEARSLYSPSGIHLYELAVEQGALNCADELKFLTVESWDRSKNLSDDLKRLVDHIDAPCGNDSIAALVESGHVISPTTSAVVLETDNQYRSFGIDAPAETNAAAPSNDFLGLQRSFSAASDSVVTQLNALNCYSALGTSRPIQDPSLLMVPYTPETLHESEKPTQQWQPWQTMLALLLELGALVLLTVRSPKATS